MTVCVWADLEMFSVCDVWQNNSSSVYTKTQNIMLKLLKYEWKFRMNSRCWETSAGDWSARRGERLTVLEKRKENCHINGVSMDIRDSFLPFEGFKYVAWIFLPVASFDVQMAIIPRCLLFSQWQLLKVIVFDYLHFLF